MKNPDITYLDKILNDKKKKMELTINLRFTDQANKIYQQLNKHDVFKNFSNKNYEEIIEFCIDIKKYIHTSTTNDRASVLLKKYLTDNNLFFYKENCLQIESNFHYHLSNAIGQYHELLFEY